MFWLAANLPHDTSHTSSSWILPSTLTTSCASVATEDAPSKRESNDSSLDLTPSTLHKSDILGIHFCHSYIHCTCIQFGTSTWIHASPTFSYKVVQTYLYMYTHFLAFLVMYIGMCLHIMYMYTTPIYIYSHH